jgi:heptosyltransferase-1
MPQRRGSALKILIVKLSSLGDVVHAMAALQDIRRALPQAQIDWVVERGFGALVRRCTGVNRVIECELRRWRKSPFSGRTRRAWRSFRAELRRESYDAVIDLQGLTKSALISWLAPLQPGGQRYGLALRSEGSSFEAPARWVADVAIALPTHIHAVERSRQLCAKALGYEVTQSAVFGLKADAIASSGGRARVALVHGTSRADKQWPVAYWQALGQRLIGQGYDIALPCGSDAEEQVARQIANGLTQAEVWPRLELDALTDALAGCAGVIGVDSGLSHIAVALNLRHVQIYNFDTAWRTGPRELSHQCSVFASPTPCVDAVWQAWLGLAQKTGST